MAWETVEITQGYGLYDFTESIKGTQRRFYRKGQENILTRRHYPLCGKRPEGELQN